MKRRIILLITALIISLNVSAQLDRSIQPKGGPTPKIKLEKPQEFKLKNGNMAKKEEKGPQDRGGARSSGTPNGRANPKKKTKTRRAKAKRI